MYISSSATLIKLTSTDTESEQKEGGKKLWGAEKEKRTYTLFLHDVTLFG